MRGLKPQIIHVDQCQLLGFLDLLLSFESETGVVREASLKKALKFGDFMFVQLKLDWTIGSSTCPIIIFCAGGWLNVSVAVPLPDQKKLVDSSCT